MDNWPLRALARFSSFSMDILANLTKSSTRQGRKTQQPLIRRQAVSRQKDCLASKITLEVALFRLVLEHEFSHWKFEARCNISLHQIPHLSFSRLSSTLIMSVWLAAKFSVRLVTPNSRCPTKTTILVPSALLKGAT